VTTEVVIKRKQWNKGGDMIQMTSPEGLVDVFGAYLLALGVDKALLVDHAMPKDLKDQLPSEANWTREQDLEGYWYDTPLAEEIAALNDYAGNNLADKKRENELIMLFERVDVKLRFEDD
jgi:hypothetical protein